MVLRHLDPDVPERPSATPLPRLLRVQRAKVEIETGKIMVGRLPPRIGRFVEQWRRRYIEELRATWARAELGEDAALGRIPGLDDE